MDYKILSYLDWCWNLMILDWKPKIIGNWLGDVHIDQKTTRVSYTCICIGGNYYTNTHTLIHTNTHTYEILVKIIHNII